MPSRVLRQRHHQILQKAANALDMQKVIDREFASVTLSLHSEDLPWAREEMKQFRRQLARRLSDRKDKNRLYEFSMQLFALDKPEETET